MLVRQWPLRVLICFSLAIWVCCWGSVSARGDGASAGIAVESIHSGSFTNGQVQRLADGTLQLGLVRVRPEQRELHFPAEVNQRSGLVEYLLVHENGKVHESVLRTAARPQHLHLGALLLGNGAPSNQPMARPVRLQAMRHGSTNSLTLESLVWDVSTGKPATGGNWTYTGSRLIQGEFTAERDGSVVALITDPDALVENPRPGRENDDNWLVNTNVVAGLSSNLNIIIQFP